MRFVVEGTFIQCLQSPVRAQVLEQLIIVLGCAFLILVLVIGFFAQQLLVQELGLRSTDNMPTEFVRRKLAAVENYGDVQGNYAQLEPIALKDLQQQGLFKGVSFDAVLSNPVIYDQVVDAYLKRLEDFGIMNEDQKVVWWLMPGRFKPSGGDIRNIKSSRLRNIMDNRVENLASYYKQLQTSEALAEG